MSRLVENNDEFYGKVRKPNKLKGNLGNVDQEFESINPYEFKKGMNYELTKVGVLTLREASEEDREKFSQQAKERWEKIPADKKKEMMEKAGRALRIAAIEGSKAEKFLQRKLNEMGYDVILHKKDLIEGNFEIDLFLPELNTIIEIDGPQHFLPVFGEKKLQEVIKFDSIKNGLLVSKGFCVVRVRYLCKNMSRAVERKLWDLVSEQVGKIQDKFPTKSKRFIELEIGHE